MRTHHILVLIAASMALQGCVAAVLPVVAGAAVARTATDGKKPGDDERAAQQQQAALEARAELSEMATSPIPEVVVQTSPGNQSRLAEADAFSELIRYSESQVQTGPEGGTPQSAILDDPTTLRERRAPCPVNIPTVLIDLDHDNALFPLATDGQASAVLANGLARLREADVDIVWISGHSAAMAGDVRLALKNSRLDPDSEDQLLLMRYPGDRKQTRRADLAKTSCVIAIAGDTREDFDELFEYLVKPEAALALELLIGQGWFLIPPAISTTGDEPPPIIDQRQSP